MEPLSWEDYKKKALQDAELKREYEALSIEYELTSEIIKARIEQHMTQGELARRVGTRQSNISRLESGEYNPSLGFLKKVAHGLGKELRISLK